MIRGYEVTVRPLSPGLGGGFVAYAPALKGCISDGGTREEARANLRDAINCWLDGARLKGRNTKRGAPAVPRAFIAVP